MSLRVEIEDSVCDGMKLVTFHKDNESSSLTMDAELAMSIKDRCDIGEIFRHGLNCDDKLTALFRNDQDRDTARDFFEDIYGDCVWRTVSC